VETIHIYLISILIPRLISTVTCNNGGQCATNVSNTRALRPSLDGYISIQHPILHDNLLILTIRAIHNHLLIMRGGSRGGSVALRHVRPYLIGLGGRSYTSPTPIGASTSGGAGGSLTQLISSGVYTSRAGGFGGGIWNTDYSYIALGGTGALAGSGNPRR
jgi:hypothetical protein